MAYQFESEDEIWLRKVWKTLQAYRENIPEIQHLLLECPIKLRTLLGPDDNSASLNTPSSPPPIFLPSTSNSLPFQSSNFSTSLLDSATTQSSSKADVDSIHIAFFFSQPLMHENPISGLESVDLLNFTEEKRVVLDSLQVHSNRQVCCLLRQRRHANARFLFLF
jgi:hypothetical protein